MADLLLHAFKIARRLPLHLQAELAARIVADVIETEERESVPHAVNRLIHETRLQPRHR